MFNSMGETDSVSLQQNLIKRDIFFCAPDSNNICFCNTPAVLSMVMCAMVRVMIHPVKHACESHILMV